MATFLKVLGWVTLAVIGLWVGLAVLEAGLDITDDMFYWLRTDLLPGLLWAGGLGLLIWGAWVVLFGPDD